MKYCTIVTLALISTVSLGQSKSFQVLRDHFRDQPEVQSFSVSGLLCRTALALAMPDEDKIRKAVKEIRHFRLIIIPREEFRNQGLTVDGFRGYLKKDSFQELADIKDNSDHVTFYHRTDGNKKDRYFVLVEESDEVVAIEMKGYIDPEIFKDVDNRIVMR